MINLTALLKHTIDESFTSAIQNAWTTVLSSLEDKWSLELRALLEQQLEGLESLEVNPLHKIILGFSEADLQQQIELSPWMINDKDSCGNTPLIWAARRDDAKAVTVLLVCEADVKAKNQRIQTALHLSRGYDCAKALIEAGADVHALDVFRLTPLYTLIFASTSADVIRLILENGADADLGHRPPLVAAAGLDKLDIVKALLDHGANIDHCCPLGFSAIQYAVQYDQPDCLRLLRDRGAKMNTVSLSGETIFDLTAWFSSIPTLKHLEEARVWGLRMGPEEMGRYWKEFNTEREAYRQKAPTEEEPIAFAELLASACLVDDKECDSLHVPEQESVRDETSQSSEDEFFDASENFAINNKS